MVEKCGKSGCDRESAHTLRFTDLLRADVDADQPIRLCEEHTREVKQFNDTDVRSVKQWLEINGEPS